MQKKPTKDKEKNFTDEIHRKMGLGGGRLPKEGKRADGRERKGTKKLLCQQQRILFCEDQGRMLPGLVK